MGEYREPHERVQYELTPADWEVAVQWRPLAYQVIRTFVQKTIGRTVSMRGKIGTPDFQWFVKDGLAYGVNAVGLCQDLEYRAVEAIAVAAHALAESDNTEFGVEKYFRKSIARELQKEFDRWVRTSANPEAKLYGGTVAPLIPEDREDFEAEGNIVYPHRGIEEPSYEDEYDLGDEPEPVLDEESQAMLDAALGALTSKEAWALRMYADGTPPDVIAERLGYDGEKSVYKLISKAREKAQTAWEAAK